MKTIILEIKTDDDFDEVDLEEIQETIFENPLNIFSISYIFI